MANQKVRIKLKAYEHEVIDQSAARRIDQHGRILHKGDRMVVDQMIGSAFAHNERRMQRDQIRFFKQLIFVDVSKKPFISQRLIREGVPGEHGHSESLADPRHALTDLPGSHDSRDLIVQVSTEQSAQREIIIPDLIDRFMKPPVRGHED